MILSGNESVWLSATGNTSLPLQYSFGTVSLTDNAQLGIYADRNSPQITTNVSINALSVLDSSFINITGRVVIIATEAQVASNARITATGNGYSKGLGPSKGSTVSNRVGGGAYGGRGGIL